MTGKSTKVMTGRELEDDRKRKRRHYRLRVQNKGTCDTCGGPCTRGKTICSRCSLPLQGKKVAQHRKNELLYKGL